MDGLIPDLSTSLAELRHQPQSGAERLAAAEPVGAADSAASAAAHVAQHVRAQQWTITVVAFGVGLWVFLDPRPYALAIFAAAAVPWVAAILACWSKGALHLMPRSKKDRSPQVSLAFMLPGVMLLLRVNQDFKAYDWTRLVVVAAVAGAALAVGTAIADPGLWRVPGAAFGAVFLCGIWGFGAGLSADALMDLSPATVYTVTVVGHHVSHGRSTTYSLLLAPWGPGNRSGSVSVPWRLYDSVAVGDSVCLPWRPGALGVAWYRVQLCR
ncbi:MAG TPA: hypothetical protein VHZ09_19740 [Acidobacteriaceae bacterium]|jgi:hypothetical protein|nr:hypothetical protein [Acidobacteriaceae bacterium]